MRPFKYFLLFFFAHFSFVSAFSNCPDVVAQFTTSQTVVCGPGPTSISFTNTSTGANAGNGSTQYEWFLNGTSFDNTNGLSTPNNSTISANGTYTYMLVATDNTAGCSDTAVVIVNIVPVPNANFTFNPNNGCAGFPVSFTNTSTGFSAGNTTYAWNFGDAGTSSATNPTHTYATGGTYNVTLTMTNGAGCSDVQNATVTVLPSPTAAFTGDDGDGDMTYCLLPGDPTTSETVVFTNNSTGAVSYAWDFGDGNTSTATNPSHTYTSFGTYTVTLVATGANGCTNTITQTVVFEKFVGASLSLDITEYSGCAPHTLTSLVNGSQNANTYTWDFGDGSPPVVTTSPVPPAHTYVAGGTFTITLTAANSCNSATATISPIIIIAGPAASFNMSTSLGCAPQNVSFVNTSTGAQPANNYQWDMGNGNTYTNVTTPPVQNYPTQGTYTVTLTGNSACGSSTVQQTIIIDSIPIIDLVVDPLEGCSPLTVTSVNNSQGNSLTYQWFVDGVFVSTAQQLPDQVFTAPAGNTAVNHTIQLNVSNHCGTVSQTETILVHPAVNAIFTMNTDTICVGDAVTFTQSSTGDFLTYAWDFGEGTTSILAGPHTITYNTPGTYSVQLDVVGFCGPSTVVHDVVVLPYPIADFTPDVTQGCMPLVVSFTNNSTLGGTYDWNFGTGASPATSAIYNPAPVTYNTAGTSTITLTVDVLGCITSTTATIDIDALPVPSFTVTPNNGCTPLDVAFTNTSAVTAGDTYEWDFGNGNTSTQQNPPNEIYTAVGVDQIYTVELIITTSAGCKDSVSSTITVHPLPVADFTPLPDTVCVGTAVAYLNNSVGGNTFEWGFGDGNTSTIMSPSHPYAAQGTYTTELIAITAFGCRDTITHNIVVDSIPTADFNFTIECLGDSTHFTDLSTGGITNWDWNFGDAGTSTLSDPAHLYAANGTYNVSLTVTNPAGCTNTLSQLVTVNAVPIAAFTTGTTCLGTASVFTDNTSGVPIAWEWDFGDATPVDNNQNPTHTYAATGTYTVQLISFGGAGCSDTTTGTITVTPIPTADFTFVQVCTNDTTFFTSTSLGAPDTYVWDFGDGNTDNTNNPNPFHIYTSSGTYNVTLTAGYAASGCTHSVTFAVDAFPRTVPGFTNNTPCLGASTNFIDLTTNNPNFWEWDFGDASPLDNTQNPSHTYATPGIFNVTLVTENAFGCSDTLVSSIEVFPLPVADYTFTIACADHTTTFTDASTNSVAWQWNFDDGSAVDLNTNPTHVFTLSGTYNVQLVVTNSDGCTDTSIQAVTVNPNPVADFASTVACHTYPNFFTDNSTGAVQWDWEFGDGSPNDNNTNTSHVYPNPGTYQTELVVTNVFGCTDSITQTTTVLLQPQSGFINNTVCAGANVQFTDTTTGSPTTWSWDFDDGSPIDNNQDPLHVFTLGGTYNITLITGNIAGCMDTTVVPIDVFTVPFPDFDYDTVCLFGITHFTDESTDPTALSSWYWDFGDGNNSFVQNPNYIYQAPGTYTVYLQVTNANGCDSSITHQVVVNDVPVAAFTSDTACVGSPTTFTDLSTGSPTGWLWNFGDGNTSTQGPTVTHTYAGPGSYIVTLFVSGGPGNCFDQTFATAFVSNSVQAGFVVQPDACQNSMVNFTDTTLIIGGVITGWSWDFGDGNTSTLQDPTHVYTTPGTYTITLDVTSSGGCTSSATTSITIFPQPTADFSANAPCQNMGTQFVDNSNGNGSAITDWDWDFGDLNGDTVQHPIHTYATSGTFNTTLIVTNADGCMDTVTLPVDVHPQPTADFNFTTECWGTPVTYTDQSTVTSGDIITNWNWNFDDGNTSTLQNPQHPFTVFNDTFNVELVVMTNAGCVDTITQTVTTLPIVEFDFGPDNANGCAPMVVQFTDNSTISQGTITGWVWDFDDATNSFQQNPIHNYNNAGEYFVVLTVTTSTGCTYTDTLDYPVTVYPQPIAGFDVSPLVTTILEPDITITDDSQGGMFWEYDFGDFSHGNDASSIHTYYAPGEYDIMQIVTNNYGCSDTAYQHVTIEEVASIYVPNAFTPGSDKKNDLFLVKGTGVSKFHLYIFDRWGELIFETEDMEEGWDGTFKGMDVHPDVYVWRVVCEYITGKQDDQYGHVTVIR